MGFLSQAGHVGFRTQTTKGAFVDPGAVAPNQGVFVRTRSGALGGNRELLIPDPEIGGHRDVPDAQLGPISFSGEYDFYARMESTAWFLKAALGFAAAPTGSASAGYTHTLTPADTLPWVSVEEKIANGYEAFNYTDAKVNTFHLEADANGYLMGTAGLIALTQTLDASPTATGTQRQDTSPLLVGTNIEVLWNGAALPAKSFSFDVNNNLEDDDFRLGSLFLGDLVEKRREVTAGVTIRPNDSALWRTAMWGAPAATTPLGQSFKDDLVIHCVTYEDIPGATAGVKYDLSLTIPQAVLTPFNLDPSGDDVVEHDVEIQAVRPSAATPIVTAAVRTSYATLP
jgi:hypothetical protein